MGLGRGNGLQASRTPGSVVGGLRPLWGGLIAAALVILTLWVAVALGMQEQELVAVAQPTATSTMLLPSATLMSAVVTQVPSSTPQPTWTPSPEPSPSVPPPSATSQPLASAQTGCVPPDGWIVRTVQSGETLSELAWRYWTTEEELAQANCLTSWILRARQRIYMPDVSPRVQQCARPDGWVDYIIRSGDTLYSLALRTGTDANTLRRVNCLPSITIYAGRTLWVPRQPTSPTATRRPTAVSTSTKVVTVTAIPTAVTLAPTDSQTPGPTGTYTVVPEPSPDTPTALPPTATMVPSAEPTNTSVPPTATEQPRPTEAPPTNTPVPPSATAGPTTP